MAPRKATPKKQSTATKPANRTTRATTASPTSSEIVKQQSPPRMPRTPRTPASRITKPTASSPPKKVLAKNIKLTARYLQKSPVRRTLFGQRKSLRALTELEKGAILPKGGPEGFVGGDVPQRSRPTNATTRKRLLTGDTEEDRSAHSPGIEHEVEGNKLASALLQALWKSERNPRNSKQPIYYEYDNLATYHEAIEDDFEDFRDRFPKGSPERRHVDELRFFYANMEHIEEAAFREMRDRVGRATLMRYRAAQFAAALSTSKSYEEAKVFSELAAFSEPELMTGKLGVIRTCQDEIASSTWLVRT